MSRLCALPLVWGIALLAEPPREIAGRVIDAQTAAPISHARIRINQLGSHPDEIVVLTSDDGAFHLANVPEGRYQFTCERAGYLPGFQSVEVAPVAAASDGKPIFVEFRLTPQAVIEGTVVDESGGAAQFANIHVLRRLANQGRRHVQVVSQAQTDDRGSFRIFNLPAGAYCIAVTIPHSGMPRVRSAYPPVFYPNSPAIANAQFMILQPGQEQQIRIRLPQPVPAREIRGQIAAAAEGAILQLRPADFINSNWPSHFNVQWNQKMRSFKFMGVTPGVYVIDASGQLDGQQVRATTKVAVAGRDITGIRLELSNEATLTGTVRVEGQAVPRPVGSILALFSPTYRFGAAIQPDGSFEFRNLPPETYRLVISSAGAAYLRSASQGGRDVLHDGLTISGETPARAT
jgi:carboxypeptidase family protein